MKPLYNSNNGRVARPRVRSLGVMPKQLMNELKQLDPFEVKRMQIAVSMNRIKN